MTRRKALCTAQVCEPPERLRRILKKLSQPGACLTALDPSQNGDSKNYAVVSLRSPKQSRELMIVEGRAVRWMREQGLLERDDEREVLSPAGTACLRRMVSGADPFQRQHQIREMTHRALGTTHRQVLVDTTESPLGWLRRRKSRDGAPMIDDAQFQAGERLRRDFCFAQMQPRVTASWSGLASSKRKRRSTSNDPAQLRDSALMAKDRVLKALDAVGPEMSGVLLDVCCYLQGLEAAEKAQGWPQRSGKIVLQIALNRLARHYGYLSDTAGKEHIHRRIAHWGAPGYRPEG